MDRVADKVLESACRWFTSAEINFARDNIDIAVYSLEMAFEIGMKSLLQKMHSDVPKTHSVEDLFVMTTEKNPGINHETKHKLLSHMGDFRTLLRLRNIAGYSFERGAELGSMKEVYENTLNSVESFLDTAKEALAELQKKPRA